MHLDFHAILLHEPVQESSSVFVNEQFVSAPENYFPFCTSYLLRFVVCNRLKRDV